MSRLPILDFRLRGPFAPNLYIRFGHRTSLIVKRTRGELFSERNGRKRVHRFMGWSWRWQPVTTPAPALESGARP